MKTLTNALVLSWLCAATACTSRSSSLLDRECKWFGKWTSYAEERVKTGTPAIATEEASSSMDHTNLATKLAAESRNVFGFEHPRVARLEIQMKRTYARESIAEQQMADAMAKGDSVTIAHAREEKAEIARERALILAEWSLDCTD